MTLEQCLTRDWGSVVSDSENSDGCFDCNICFDFAHDPVVTICGHLYCWPCIYKWLHFQSASLASDEHPQCPVCKAEISHTTMVPLYGRGQIPIQQDSKGKATHFSMAIPPRPAAFRTQEALASLNSHTSQQIQYQNPYQSQQYYHHPQEHHEEDYPPSMLNMEETRTAGILHPMGSLFGEMVYAQVFGNSSGLHAYPNSYHAVVNSSPRLRRLETQADKSLNRISIFLCCCVLLCLLLF